MAGVLGNFIAQPQTSGLLDAIKAKESSGGTDPRARVLGPKGALGNFQLTASLYKDIQRDFPEFKSISFEEAALTEGLDRQVAEAGLQSITRNLASEGVASTPDAVIQAYHSGAGNVRRGTIGPEGKDYLTSILRALNAK